MGIRIPAQVSKVNNPASTSTQSFRPKSVLDALDGQDLDDIDSDDDNEIMAMAEEEEDGGGGGNGEEEEEESSQEEDDKDKEDEPPAVNLKVPQKRKNVRVGASGSRST
jgi:ribosomal protein L12E/L44/L45/RPP1/RPP2